MEISNFDINDYEAAVVFWNSIDGISINESDSLGAISQFLDRNPGLSFVAKSADGLIIGTVLCGHNGRAGQIYHLAVSNTYRKQGLGRKLVELCLAKLADANIPRCNIFVYTQNKTGNEFWLNTGWNDPTDWKVLQKII